MPHSKDGERGRAVVVDRGKGDLVANFKAGLKEVVRAVVPGGGLVVRAGDRVDPAMVVGPTGGRGHRPRSNLPSRCWNSTSPWFRMKKGWNRLHGKSA
jgi:hypothetical protein